MKAPTLLLLAILATVPAAHAKKHHQDAAPGQFDYYTVALSWSPTFCASHRDPGQCDAGHELGFVLHGVWPQFERGFPESCSSVQLSDAVRSQYAGIYASPNLIGHEWSKHGTCSGLDPAGYFAMSQKLKEQLVIPKQFQRPREEERSNYNEFVKAFRKANPGMPVNSILPFCGNGGRFLSEVRACYDKGGAPRQCSTGEVKRSFSSCRMQDFVLPGVR
jgi:ribonuclease T2